MAEDPTYDIQLEAEQINTALRQVHGADLFPSETSDNMVRSGGVFTALATLESTVDSRLAVEKNGTVYDGPMFTKWFESVARSVPPQDTTISYPHGLGGVPKIGQLILRCVSADHGYFPGDEISPGDYGDAGYITSVWVNSTEVSHRRASPTFYVASGASYAKIYADDPNWEVFMRAFI